MAPLVQLLACVPGPKEGAAFGGKHFEDQVRQTMLNRGCSEVSEAPIATMTHFLKSDRCQWLYFSMIDFMSHQEGAVHKGPHSGFNGLLRGDIYFGDSGMLFSFEITQRNAFECVHAAFHIAFLGIIPVR